MNPARVVESTDPEPALLFSCEHAGNALPAGVDARGLIESHWAFDLGAAELVADIARRLGAPAVLAPFSRLWIDPNRSPRDPELIVQSCGGHPIPFNLGIDAAEREHRQLRWHGGFHDRLAEEISKHASLRLLVSIHTFTPTLRGLERPYSLGVLHDGPSDSVRALFRALRSEGFDPRDNEPYSGFDGMIYSIARHGVESGVPYVELEVRNDKTRSTMPARLARALRSALD